MQCSAIHYTWLTIVAVTIHRGKLTFSQEPRDQVANILPLSVMWSRPQRGDMGLLPWLCVDVVTRLSPDWSSSGGDSATVRYTTGWRGETLASEVSPLCESARWRDLIVLINIVSATSLGQTRVRIHSRQPGETEPQLTEVYWNLLSWTRHLWSGLF